MDVAAEDGLAPALAQARELADDPWTVERAIASLEELATALAPRAAVAADDRLDRPAAYERVRTVLSTHLLAVRALQEVGASDAAVARLVRRGIDGAETAAAAVRPAPTAGP